MKENLCNVLYFSAAGSCKKIAEYLGERVTGAKVTDISPYRARLTPVEAAESYIFIFPVYNGAIPKACADFIKNLNGLGKRARILCVYGGVYKGKALENAAALIKSAGFNAVRGGYAAAPHVYAEKKINTLTESRLNSIYEGLLLLSGRKKLKAVKSAKGWQRQPHMKKLTGACKVEKELCTGCGLCKKVCPANAINGEYSSGKQCILCGACVSACPASARKIRFFSPIPPLFIKLKSKRRDDEFFDIL